MANWIALNVMIQSLVNEKTILVDVYQWLANAAKSLQFIAKALDSETAIEQIFITTWMYLASINADVASYRLLFSEEIAAQLIMGNKLDNYKLSFYCFFDWSRNGWERKFTIGFGSDCSTIRIVQSSYGL